MGYKLGGWGGEGAIIFREFVNFRHPGPRRVWKVGSELQSTTLDPADPLACAKVRFCLSETIIRLQGKACQITNYFFFIKIVLTGATWGAAGWAPGSGITIPRACRTSLKNRLFSGPLQKRLRVIPAGAAAAKASKMGPNRVPP